MGDEGLDAASDLLDEIADRIADLPEPVAAVAVGVEIARAEGDATGIAKRLFELGIATVHYGFAISMSIVARAIDGQCAPKPLAKALSTAARLSDGQWCALARSASSQLRALNAPGNEYFSWLSNSALARMIEARNGFVHGGESGDRAPELVLAVL